VVLSRRLAVLALVLVPAISPADAAPTVKRSLALELAPRGDWRTAALAQALTADLADDRLAPRPSPACGGPCGDDALRAAGIALVVRATLSPGVDATLGYELRALWPGAPPPVLGSIVLPGLDRVRLAGALRDRLHRLGRSTGDDDEPAAAARAASGAPAVTARDLPTPRELAWLVVLALGVLGLPLLVGAVRLRRFAARAAAWRTGAGVAGLAAAALALSLLGPANSRGVLLAAGGLAWGTLVAVTLPVVLPPLVGLGSTDYSELARLLAAWSGLVVQRALLLAAIYVPAALGALAACDALDLGDPPARVAVILPLALLVVRQAVRLAIAVAAEHLDAALADPGVDSAAWHTAARGYLVGYLQRNGLTLDGELLERITIVPAAGDQVAVYGGGATNARVAVPRRMLELALAPWGRPHDYAAPRISTLHWTQWNAGLVMATAQGAPIATPEQRQPRETTTEGDPSEHAREPLGEPPTLAGIIEPAALDPRSRYRPHDDPAWLDWDSGEEHDGTDAGDRDFLFGVLLRAVAELQRHGGAPSTVALVLQRAGRLTAPLGRLLDRMSDAAGDDHAAIRGARHHLVQYLGWEAWQREDLLTARAYAPELVAMSRRVLAERATPASRPVAAAERARRRLARLAALVDGASAAPTRWRRLALACALAAGTAGAASAILDAVRFHATYTERQKSTMENPSHGKD